MKVFIVQKVYMTKYCITAYSTDNIKMYATYDYVYDSCMLPGKTKDIVEFFSKREAELAINNYQSFQRYLTNFQVEEL